MFLANTSAAANCKKSPTRSESPGGYFTLSDSDGGSNPGTESSIDDELPGQDQKLNVYKMYKRSRSEPPTATTSSSAKKVAKESGPEPGAPPRPPPPLSYTSTLPPPVPKKMSKRISNGSSNKRIYPPPPPPPLTHYGPKAKPLQRVQPLQLQSPSMIQILQPRHHGSTSSNSSDENSIDGSVTMQRSNEPVTFLTAYQRAMSHTTSSQFADPNLRPRQALKCELNKNKKSVVKTTSNNTAGYMKPTKTAVLKQANQPQIQPPSVGKSENMTSENNNKKAVSSSASKARRSISSSSSLSDENSAENVKKKKVRNKMNEGSKLKKLKNSAVACCSNELTRSASDKSVLTSDSGPKKSAKSKSETNVNKTKNPIHSLIKFYETSKPKMVVLEDKDDLCKDVKRVSNSSHLSQISQLSADKIQTWLSSPISQTAAAPDYKLTEINVLDKYVTDMISLADVTLKDVSSDCDSQSSEDKYPRVIMKSPKFIRKTTESMKLLQKNVKNHSDKKVDKSTQSPKMAKKSPQLVRKITESEPQKSPKMDDKKSKLSRKTCESPKVTRKCQKSPRVNYTEIKSDVETSAKSEGGEITTQEPKLKPQITVIEDKVPSEEEINRGVFTEVSCSGNVKKQAISTQQQSLTLPPTPSPRVKKKARKEQMLLEHKEMGHHAISLALKQLKQVDKKSENHIPAELSKEDAIGIQCLNDLCSQTQFIQVDISRSDGCSSKKEAKSNENQVGTTSNSNCSRNFTCKFPICIFICFFGLMIIARAAIFLCSPAERDRKVIWSKSRKSSSLKDSIDCV